MRWTPALLVLLTGCWPYIPGKYAGGEPAESTVVVGELWRDTFLGTYWDDTTPSITGWVATVDPPQDVFAVEIYGGSSGACARNAALPSWYPAGFATDGSGAVTFSGSAVQAVANWDPTNSLFSTGTVDSPAATSEDWWSVAGVNAGPYGPYDLDDAVYLPEPLTLTAPVGLDGASLITMTLADVPLAWTGASDADEVVAQVFFVDSTGAAVELIECRMPNTGSFVIPLATLSTQWSASDYAILRVAAVAQNDVKVDFHPTAGNRMAGFSSVQGAFATQ